jgi:hypothetical protein
MCALSVLELVTCLLFVKFDSFYANDMSFMPVKHWVTGVYMCAVDTPTAEIPLSNYVSSDIPNEVRCGFECTCFSGCTSFNFVKRPVALCQLYTFIPTNCVTSPTTENNCTHFEVSFSLVFFIHFCFDEAPSIS